MDKAKKIQQLLITHLLDKGYIELKMPDGMIVELGIVQEDKNGSLVKTDNYAWLIASQKDRIVSMDSYTCGIKYAENANKIIYEDTSIDHDGQKMHVLSAI